jgi:uncharacterized protein YxeA
MKNILHWLMVVQIIIALLPVTAGAQGWQRLQYQSFNMLAAAQDASTNPEADSQRQEQDRAVSITGLFFIVVVVALGVIFAIVMIAGHGKRQYP